MDRKNVKFQFKLRRIYAVWWDEIPRKTSRKKTIIARITKWLVKVDFLGGWERNTS